MSQAAHSAEAISAAVPHASASFLRLNGLASGANVPRGTFVESPTLPPSLPVVHVLTVAGKKRIQVTAATKAAKAKLARAGRVSRTRNAGTWTEAEFWGRLRSCLRKLSQFWKPARAALQASRVPFRGPNGQKWAYLCADCKKLHPRKRVHIDHIVPCGALTDFAHVGEFIRRLTPEDPAAYAVRCLSCHQAKTNAERKPNGADQPRRGDKQ